MALNDFDPYNMNCLTCLFKYFDQFCSVCIETVDKSIYLLELLTKNKIYI